MKSLAMLVLFGFLAFGAAAQTPGPTPATPTKTVPAPRAEPTQADIDAWNAAAFKYNAQVQTLNARITELKHLTGVDLLEADNAAEGQRLLATIPAGYHIDPQTQRLAKNPPEAPKTPENTKSPQSGKPAEKKQ